jgi:hypothetical protein
MSHDMCDGFLSIQTEVAVVKRNVIGEECVKNTEKRNISHAETWSHVLIFIRQDNVLIQFSGRSISSFRSPWPDWFNQVHELNSSKAWKRIEGQALNNRQ